MNSQKPSSIHKKIFWSTSLIASCVIFIILLCTSGIFYKRYLDLEVSSSLSHLEYISNQLDFYLTSVTNYARSICVNDVIQEKLVKYNLEQKSYDAIEQMKIRAEINQVIQSTPFIHSVTVYSKDTAHVASTDMFSLRANISPVPKGNSPLWIAQEKKSPLSRQIAEPVLSLIRPLYRVTTGDLLGYLEISIPEKTISAIYKEQTSEYSKILITDEQGLIQSSYDEPLQTPCSFQNHMPDKRDKNFYYHEQSIIFYAYYDTLGWYVFHEFNLLRFLQPTFATFGLSVIIGVFCIAICFFISHRLSTTITAPIYRLIGHTRKIKEGNWTTIEQEHGTDHDIGHLFEAFNSMIVAQQKLQDDLMASEKMKSKISLDLLQQQVNPHFLYNTLDNICSLAELDEKDMLLDIVMNLSAFYRKALSSGRFDVTIEDELNMTKAYLHIMQIRYFNKFEFTISCSEALLHYGCLKLLLQPIVENSIYHGIKEMNGAGRLTIDITQQEDYILFIIEDNGAGLSQETINRLWKTDSNHFGVKNIHQRIRLYYGDDCGLTIESPSHNGCIVTLKIKKQEGLPNAT